MGLEIRPLSLHLVLEHGQVAARLTDLEHQMFLFLAYTMLLKFTFTKARALLADTQH